MNKSSRLLQPGAMVRTDYTGKWTEHKIVERTEFQSQSGVGFRVEPIVRGSTGGLLDADWFRPIAAKRPDPDDELDGDAAIFAENGL